MNSSIILRERSRKISNHLYNLVFTRTMTKGRICAGGLTPWQYKRLQDKKAIEIKKKLLEQKQHMSQAQVRTDRRAELSSRESPRQLPSSIRDSPRQLRSSIRDSLRLLPSSVRDSPWGPMSPNDHICALADKFVKEGAEDLWNEDDGPVVESTQALASAQFPSNVRSRRRSRLIGSPVNVQKLISDNRNRNGSFISAGNDNWMYPQNEDDGPFVESTSASTKLPSIVRSRKPRSGLIGSPINVQKLISDDTNRNSSDNDNWMYAQNGFMRFIHYYSTCSVLSNFHSVRNYSVQAGRRFRRNECSASDDDCGPVTGPVKDFASKSRWRGLRSMGEKSSSDGAAALREKRKGKKMIGRSAAKKKPRRIESYSSDDDNDDYGPLSGPGKNLFSDSRLGSLRLKDEESAADGAVELREKRNGTKMIGSSAALGNYDVKRTRKVPSKVLDEVDDFSEQVQFLKDELIKKNLMEKEAEVSGEGSLLSERRFDECGVSSLTVKALSAAGYIQMTRAQEATLSVTLEGKDALVKAKTGTGKSLAFLLPAIEAVLKATSSPTNHRASPICVLILTPTRELASQIAAEAKVMVKHHDGIGVQTLIGGTRFKVDLKSLESEPCQIIVATPARLLDHVESKTGFSARLMRLKMLIVDEADHLLDLGFRKDMETIVDCLPRSRQSLLFSATLPKEVRRVSQLVLKREHVYIDTIRGCVEFPTKVKQSYLIAPHEQHFHIVHHILKEHISEVVNYKVIVFCSTAMVTSFLYTLLREMRMNVRDIHSRKPEIYRTRISDEFKESKRIILVTSDVSVRGMNYPDVTLVVQVGLPSDQEQYVHRLGRTGREGKDGESILLLAPWEEYFVDEVKSLPIEKFPLPNLEPNMKLMLDDSLAKIDTSVKEGAYHAWLGYYNSIKVIGRDKTTLVERANKFAESIGLHTAPSMLKKTALRMGLNDIPGIRLRK